MFVVEEAGEVGVSVVVNVDVVGREEVDILRMGCGSGWLELRRR